MSIEQYIETLLGVEGGYVDHPHDRGGPTNWGITQEVARAWGYRGNMRDLPRPVAANIYRERYWTQPKFDEVNKLSAAIAEEMFDAGVNLGPAVATRFLQRALNVLNQAETLYRDVDVDGAIGRLTLAALETYLKRWKKDSEVVLLRMLNAQQSVRYMELAERDKRQESFEYGWQRQRVS